MGPVDGKLTMYLEAIWGRRGSTVSNGTVYGRKSQRCIV